MAEINENEVLYMLTIPRFNMPDFGSLDEESLHQALHALTDLARSDRLVGIISHVADLRAAIDRQILVTKAPTGGSHATIL